MLLTDGPTDGPTTRRLELLWEANNLDREMRLRELKSMLLDINYPERLVDSAIDRAR